MVSSCVLPSKSCPSRVCLQKNNLFPQCVGSIYRFWSRFITLSYSYLTLPEKQSSSAVTWASTGCHVFLKGCLRGTLQLEVSLLTCSIHLCIPRFVFTHEFDYILHSEPQFHFCGLCCLIVVFCCLSQSFQLAVISFGADKLQMNCKVDKASINLLKTNEDLC